MESFKATMARHAPDCRKLTAEEKRIARCLLSTGASVKGIAIYLGKSVETVKHQVVAIRDRTGMDTTTAAMLFILRSPELLAEVFEQ